MGRGVGRRKGKLGREADKSRHQLHFVSFLNSLGTDILVFGFGSNNLNTV